MLTDKGSIMAIRCFSPLIFNLDLFYWRIVMKPSSALDCRLLETFPLDSLFCALFMTQMVYRF